MAYGFTKHVAGILIVAIAALALPASSWAVKVAVVDMATVYKNFREVTKSQAFLKEKKDEYQNVIDKEKYSLKEEELALEQLKEDLRTNKDKYSATELQTKENEQRRLVASWQQKFQTMKTKFEEYKTQLEDLERKEFQNIRTKVDAAIASVAGRLKVDLVFEKQWVYFGNTVDVTEQIMKELEGTR